MFKNYSTGVFNEKNCNGVLNHAAIAVGYNLNHSIPHLIVKNAWGNDWGENGYYNIAVGNMGKKDKGICGMFGHPLNVVPVLD